MNYRPRYSVRPGCGRSRPDQGDPLAVKQERAGYREHPSLPVPVLERYRVLLQRHHRAAETRLEVLHDQPGLGFDLVNGPLSGLGLAVLRREHVTPVLSALHQSYPNPAGPPEPGGSPGAPVRPSIVARKRNPTVLAVRRVS